MISEGKVGLQTLTDGAVNPLRTARDGSVVVSQYQPRLMAAVLSGNTFIASNVGAQAVSVALATAYTGLVLSNPLGSGKNLVLLGGQYTLTVAPAGIASLHLIGAFSATAVTHTTPLAAPGIQNCFIGAGAATVAKVDSSATIPTPNYIMGLGSGFTAAALYATTPTWINFEGSIVLPPSSFIAWGALTAVTGFGTLMWQEVPV